MERRIEGVKMKASLKKRMNAYLIDLIILLIVLSLIGFLYTPNNVSLNSQMDLITVQYANGDIQFSEYMTDLSALYKQIDLNNIFLNIINVLYIIAYFVVFPYFYHGQTVGKRIMNIEVKAKSNIKLTLLKLFLRNLIITGLIYFMAVIVCSFTVHENYYFMIITALGIIQIILILISIIMVLYRTDRKGLHDIIAGTWVASTK